MERELCHCCKARPLAFPQLPQLAKLHFKPSRDKEISETRQVCARGQSLPTTEERSINAPVKDCLNKPGLSEASLICTCATANVIAHHRSQWLHERKQPNPVARTNAHSTRITHARGILLNPRTHTIGPITAIGSKPSAQHGTIEGQPKSQSLRPRRLQ